MFHVNRSLRGIELTAVITSVSLFLRFPGVFGFSPLIEIIWLYLLCGVLILFEIRREKPRFNAICFLSALAMTASFFACFILHSHSLSTTPLKFLGSFLVFLAFYLLFWAFSRLNLTSFRSLDPGRHLRGGELVLLCAVYLLILFICYRYAFPYVKSGDTTSQWNQIHGIEPYTTIHAIGHTIFLKVLLSVWASYIFVILVHIASLTALYLFLSDYAYTKGIPPWFSCLLCSLALIWTIAATEAYFAPWKDTPAAICLCLVSLLIARHLDGAGLTVPQALLLGIVLAWCALFRLNGLIAVLVCGMFFLLSFLKRQQGRQLAAFLLGLTVSFGSVSLYSSLMLHPASPENGFALQVLGSGIAAVVHDDPITDSEREEIDSLLPIDWMQSHYTDMYSKRGLFWDRDLCARIQEDPTLAIMNNDFVLHLGDHKLEVIQLYFRLLPHHFRTMFFDALGSFSLIWSQETPLFVTNPLFWAALIAVLACQIHLPLYKWAVFLPCICNTISIMLATATNERRYMLPSFLIAPFYIIYLIEQAPQRE